MFFKSKLLIVGFLLFSLPLSLLLSGCGDFLKGKKTADVINSDSPGNACLKTVPVFLAAYFADKAMAQDIDQNFDCVKAAFKTFLKFTRGEDSDQYTDKEIQHFFNRYLLSDNQISDSFLEQIMKLKVMVVSGGQHTFTRVEIDQLVVYLDLIRTQFKDLQGLMNLILFQQKPEQVSVGDLKAAQAKVIKAVNELTLALKIMPSDFVFMDIQKFVTELNTFLGSEGKFSDFVKWFPLANSVKGLFLGQHLGVQSSVQWSDSISWVVETYFLAQEFFYHTRQLKFKTGGDWDAAIYFVDLVFDLIDRSPNMMAKRFLVTEDIDKFISELWKLNLFSSMINVEIAKNTYKKVIYHLIDSKTSVRGETFELREVGQRQFAIIRLEYEVWRQTQLMIARIFSEQKGSLISRAEILEKMKKYERPPAKPSLKGLQGLLTGAWEEWFALMNKNHQAVLTSKLKIAIDHDLSSLQQSLSGLSLTAGIRSMIRLIVRGYGDSSSGRDLFASALTEARIIDLEFDFREFGQANGFLDPRQNGAPQRTFKEGNFFTFSGNGDSRLDGTEAFELLHFMFSAGSSVTSVIERYIEEQQGHLEEKDIMKRPKSKEPVFRKVVDEHFADIFDNLPKLVLAKQKMSIQDWNDFYLICLNLARFSDSKSGITEFAEIRSFASIIQYVESVFIQFDVDKSGGLSVAELQAAEPRFHELIKKLSPLKSDWIIREAFLFLVYQGRVPAMDTELLSFGRKRLAGSDMGEATRLQLFRVLGVLKENAL